MDAAAAGTCHQPRGCPCRSRVNALAPLLPKPVMVPAAAKAAVGTAARVALADAQLNDGIQAVAGDEHGIGLGDQRASLRLSDPPAMKRAMPAGLPLGLKVVSKSPPAANTVEAAPALQRRSASDVAQARDEMSIVHLHLLLANAALAVGVIENRCSAGAQAPLETAFWVSALPRKPSSRRSQSRLSV